MDLLNGPLSCQNSVKGLVSTCFLFYQCLFVCLQYPEAASWPRLQPPPPDFWPLLETQSLPGERLFESTMPTLFLLTIHRGCSGSLQTMILSWKSYCVAAPRRVLRVRSGTLAVRAGASCRSCAGIPLVARAFRNGYSACWLHAPPSVETRRLCCLKPSVAWLRWGQIHMGLNEAGTCGLHNKGRKWQKKEIG